MSTLRSRSISTNQATTIEKPAISTTISSAASDDEPEITSNNSSQQLLLPQQQLPPLSVPMTLQPPSLAQRAITQTLATTANLANLLPTGTLLSLQLLTPIFTKNGVCDSATRPMTFILLFILSLSCLLACLTDSFKSPEGQVYYGLATFKGMWLFDYPYNPASTTANILDLRKYKLRFIDGVHGILSMMVFVAVALRDRNVVNCFYPQPVHEIQEVLDIVPVGIGFICSLLFAIFPTTRHGIGFPVTSKN